MGRPKSEIAKYTTSVSIPLEYKQQITESRLSMGDLIVLGLDHERLEKEISNLTEQILKIEKALLYMQQKVIEQNDEIERLRV